MTINIPASSIIRKAFLFCGRHGDPNPINVVFESNVLTLDNSTQISLPFLSPFYAGLNGQGSVHAIDISQYIYPTQSNYQITIPPQLLPNIRYTDFYLIVLYSNNSLQKVTTSFFINTSNIGKFITYSVNNINPIFTSADVGLSIHGGYMCDTTTEPTIVHLNTGIIGKIGGNDYNNSFPCGGVVGSFYYQNNSLFGLGDDTPDNLMLGSDGLANISGYLANLTNNLGVIFEVQSNNVDNQESNPVWDIFLTYTTPCDTFSVNLLTEDTTICQGTSVQLGAFSVNPNAKYEWLPQKDLSCYNCANPVFTGDSSQVYTVRVWNTDSCSKVLPVRVKVLPQPQFTSMVTTPTNCGDNTGGISTSSTGTLASADSLFSNNVYVGKTPQTLTNLGAGNYTLYLVDTNSCKSKDTSVTINSNNLTNALFTLNPSTGAVPLAVSSDNQSTHATDYLWYFQNDSTTTFAPNMQFDTSGTYTITLIAYNNTPDCSDTFSLQIVVYDSLQLIIPNVFTPNGDNQNDVFSIQVNAPCSGTIVITNRWGNELFSKNFTADGKQKISLWNGASQGKPVSDGTYFYLLKLQNKKGKDYHFQGFVELVR